MNWWLEQVLGILLLVVVLTAVVWEVTHLIEWHSLMADGPAEYLRGHAYEYVRWMFGTDFGWVRG